jgi:hypothetical protein
MKTRIKFIKYSNNIIKYQVQAFRLRELRSFKDMFDDPFYFIYSVIIIIPYFIHYLISYLFLWENKSIYNSLEDAKKDIDEMHEYLKQKEKQKEKEKLDDIYIRKSKKVVSKTYIKYP